MDALATASPGEGEAPALFAFDNSYARLPERFYVRQAPTPVGAPRLVAFNRALAEELGLRLEGVSRETLAQIFSGNAAPRGAEPIALAYAGHQFGGFAPQLGDGRAILLGEVIDRRGERRDIQLKGSGPTAFSRRGDGRAALGPALREYLVSEAMRALGVPTTRALAVATTGERVIREALLPGALVTRVAASHLRVGTFEYFAARDDLEALRRLVDYAIARHYPELAGAETPALALIEAVGERQARLMARWLALGFIHGVMNTDNTAISGETIDYGPCAFMDAYDPATVFSSIDHQGRYAYANQPRIAQWNLARFAETLLPLIDADGAKAVERASAAVSAYGLRFDSAWLAAMRAKIGLAEPQDGDAELIGALLQAMRSGEADFTLTFRRLADAAASDEGSDDDGVRAQFADVAAFDAWSERWRARLGREKRPPATRAAAMRAVNPAIIPRNHRVEAALEAASERDDFAPFETLREVLARPYEDRPEFAAFAAPPKPDERVLQTFCGT